MLKYLNYSIFLITLGIVSVTPAFNNFVEYENRMRAPNAYNPFGIGLPPFGNRFQPITPMGFGKPLLQRLSFGGDVDDLLNNMLTTLLKLKQSLANEQNGNANMEEIHECCDSAGQCRDIQKGELCNGIVKSHFKMQIGPQAFPSSDKNSNSPKPAENKLNIPVTSGENADSKPPFKSDADMQKLSDDLNGMGINKMQSEEDHTVDGPPEGGKKIGNSNMFYVMPPEKAVQKHKYEKPKGLTDAEVNAYRDEVLDKTNMYREKHGLNSVSLNEDMNNHAQEWANILAPEQGLRHRTDKDNKIYGENLYYISDSIEHLGEVAVNAWYNELRFIRPDDDENRYQHPRGTIGHLTQLLWKRSKEMGVGVAKNQNGGYVVVANYNPGGNVFPFYKDNLPEFTQEAIEAAQKAHEIHEKKMNTPRLATFNSRQKSSLGRSSSFGNPQFERSQFGNLFGGGGRLF